MKTKHRRFCDLESQGDHRYSQMLLEDVGCESKVPASEGLNLIARMKSCPHWVKRSDCGCGVNECRRGKGRGGEVTHQECFDCLKAIEPLPPSTEARDS